jgi:hypothetical protein
LGVTFWINVVLQNQVVFMVRHFVRKLQVSRFKPRFKDQSLIRSTTGLIVVERWEWHWFQALLILVCAHANAVLGFQQFLEIACSY